MKKRGLIISTIVMMLVVVVALSTATYAWFAVSADAKISTLTVQTAASDGLQIGSYYGGKAYNGTMDLSTGTVKTWTSETEGFGSELVFETALSSAYGVTGNGLNGNMWTAASRNVLSYATTQVTETWFNAHGKAYVDGSGQFYINSTGLTLASGDQFTSGAYSGDAKLAAYYLVGGTFQENDPEWTIENDADEDNDYVLDHFDLAANGNGYYIRTKGFDTVLVDAANADAFFADEDTVYYNDGAATIFATSGTADVFGVDGKKGTAATNDATATTTIRGKYVRKTTDTAITGHDVETTWAYDANNGAINGTGNDAKPKYLIAARDNVEYFSMNYVLKTQRGMITGGGRTNVADIFLKKLTVTASGGMGASARIAIYEYASNAFNGTPDLKYVYAPFAASSYNSAWLNALDGTTYTYQPSTYYTAPNKETIANAEQWDGSGYAYKETDKGTGTFAGDRVINNGTLVNVGGTWQTATFFNIDKTVDWNSLANDYTNCQTGLLTQTGSVIDGNKTREMKSIGAFSAANTEKYYQLVIWFEGTDTECINTYAGTGVTVDIAFDFYQRWTTGVIYTGFPKVVGVDFATIASRIE